MTNHTQASRSSHHCANHSVIITNHRELFGLTRGVERGKIVKALKVKNKVIGADKIPVEAWRALGDGVDLLWKLMCKIKEQEDITDKWKENVSLVSCPEEEQEAQYLYSDNWLKSTEKIRRNNIWVFIDLQKACDRRLRQELWRWLREWKVRKNM
ncbi:uncharacterized protein LOC135096386 [Scylla paramamosain]|uniref:uncharacterized protein LOC135096386 n=1 Tax=Scylla paramamosain TaxID=85552 RepID=UPI003083843A